MSQREIKCVHCQNPLMIDDDWAGMEVTCAWCQRNFRLPPTRPEPLPPGRNLSPVVPQMFSPAVPAAGYEEEPEQRRSLNIGMIIKIILLLVLLAGGVMIYLKCTEFTPEDMDGNEFYAVTKTRMNRSGIYGVIEIARTDFFPFANFSKDFFYRNVSFKDLRIIEKEKDLYEGTVIFTRGGVKKEMSRPIIIDRRGSFTHYRFPVRYDENPEYLQDDGDMIFELACSINKDLEGWNYESGEVSGESTLICTISRNGEQKKIPIKVSVVTGEDKIDRVWLEFEE